MTPVFLGSAYKNKGVQPLLDAVTRYLPSPLESPIKALAHDDPHKEVPLGPDPAKPMVGMAFKIVEDSYGTLTFMRVYQGTIQKGESYFNQRTGRKERFSRIVRMHADQREDIDSAEAGDIVAVMGLDAASGDTYCSQYPYCTLESMFVPEPVIKVAVAPANRDGADRLSKALHRFRREDPTLHISTDEETSETIMAGMGELHLEIYIERIRREYGVEVEVGAQGQLSRGPHPGLQVQHQAQEADRRVRPVRPHRRPHGAAAGDSRNLRLRGGGRRRADSQELHSRRREGLPPDGPQGTHRRLPGGRPEGDLGRRFLSRRRQFGHGLPDLRRGPACGRTFPPPGRCCWSR